MSDSERRARERSLGAGDAREALLLAQTLRREGEVEPAFEVLAPLVWNEDVRRELGSFPAALTTSAGRGEVHARADVPILERAPVVRWTRAVSDGPPSVRPVKVLRAAPAGLIFGTTCVVLDPLAGKELHRGTPGGELVGGHFLAPEHDRLVVRDAWTGAVVRSHRGRAVLGALRAGVLLFQHNARFSAVPLEQLEVPVPSPAWSFTLDPSDVLVAFSSELVLIEQAPEGAPVTHRALDARTGKERWRRSIALASGPYLLDRFAGAFMADELGYACEVRSSFGEYTPTGEEPPSELHLRDAEGELRWVREHATLVALTRSFVLAQSLSGYGYELIDRASGTTRATIAIGADATCSVRDGLYVACGRAIAAHGSDGRVLWETTLEGEADVLCLSALTRTLFALRADGTVTRLD